MTRILTAVIGIPVLVYIIQFAPPSICVSVILIAMLLTLHEYFVLVKEQVPPYFRWSGFLFASLIVLSFLLQSVVVELPFFVFPAGSILMLTLALFSGAGLRQSLEACVYTLFGALYVGGLMGTMAGIRMIDWGGETGADLLMMLFCIIWAGDTFAYFCGRLMGRHKLAPVVSPNKTVEGAVAGFVFSVLAGIGCRFGFVQQITVMDSAILGAVVGVMGQIGDLCESVIKRAAQVKDSGAILPGHGGMLDRVDSLLFGAPAMYYYFYLVLQI